MSKIKSLLLASSLCIATVCINFPAHATERHLLEQTVSYEDRTLPPTTLPLSAPAKSAPDAPTTKPCKP